MMLSLQAVRTKSVMLITALGLLMPAMKADAQNLIRYVDPTIGTGGHGHTYPGATVPFGMVQLSPDNGSQGWDWCSGYNYSDTVIAGFSHLHLSGTGCGDWTDISVMPNIGLFPETSGFYKTGFSHDNEKKEPGFYGVHLNNGIDVALTTTERCGLHKYTFPAGSMPVIRFDLGYSINWDVASETYIKYVNDSTIVGYRFSNGWARNQRVYFAARTSVPFKTLYLSGDGKHTEWQLKAKNVKGQLVFDDNRGYPIMMKVALSSVGTYKALDALNEIQGWDFEAVKQDAQQAWEHELEKITIGTTDDKLKRIFYTALYHTCMAPVLYSDADGQYQNAKGEVLKMAKGQRYTVYSLWDTYRGLNPLFTITQPERNIDILNSMLAFYDENGLLPVWDLSTYETNCMSGYHAIPVLADAILKNYPGLDAERAYKAMRASAFQDIRGTADYRKYGYLPQDKSNESVAITLGYAYDDWCIAQVARKLDKMDDYKLFMDRANAYRLLFDKTTGFIRGKNSDGSWVKPFDPIVASNSYQEGNAWQYTFNVAHDVRGLAKEFGSYANFGKKLDSLFKVPAGSLGENAPPDISGLIGQYAHGNEPSHHIAYMYDFIGQPWKTQKMVRMIVDSMYHDQPDGYSGNEDCGQMSAWAIWSIIGFYPANAASSQYTFGSPMCDNVSIKMPGGSVMVVKTRNNAKDHPYIQSVKLNGKPYTKTYIDHATMMNGGELEFTMGAKPNKKWGVKPADWPASAHN